MSNHDSMHAEWAATQNTFSFKTLIAEEGEEENYQLVAMYPNIIDIIEGANKITSLLASRLRRSMRIFTENCGKDNHYL